MEAIDMLDAPSPGAPTFDQLRVLVAVAETGSFSAAARRLRRAQSVVSYTIANLEAQLDLTLFERGPPRPALTDAGRAVLADARRLTGAMDELRARAAGMARGLEAELGLAVDVMFPTEQLVTLLDAFAQVYPTVGLRLRVEALGGAVQLVLDGECALGITGPMGERHAVLDHRAVGSVELIPVAAPTHPLARETGPIAKSVAREHTQLVLTDRSRLTEGQDFGVLAHRTWRLGDLHAKHELLRAGLGWGSMPACAVAADLEAGRLVRLDIAGREIHAYPLMLIRRGDAVPGPAAQWLAGRIGGTAS